MATATERLTDTKEGRFVVIAVVGGTLMLAAAVGNLVVAGAADRDAERIRAALRSELAVVSDEVIAGYPDTRSTIEDIALDAVAGEPGQLLGTAQVDDGEILVRVQSRQAWHSRCVEAELRGNATVLTYVRPAPC